MQDNLPFPSWWSGVCDTNDYYAQTGTNAFQLGTANYRGVVACGPRPIGDNGKDVLVYFFPDDKVGAVEWECVELSMRYMYLAYGIDPYSANGDDVVSNYQQYNPNNPILQPINNPTMGMEPQPGDILSYAGTKKIPGGHTSVVRATKYTSPGYGTITVLEENASSQGTQTLHMNNWFINSGVTGWLRHTIDVTPQSAYPGSNVNTSGVGFGANEQVIITLGGTQVGTVTTDSTGAFSSTITIPASTQPGTDTLTAIGQNSGFSPQTVFYVQTNWPMNGFDAQQTNYNPSETTITPGNVSNLTLAWNPSNYPSNGDAPVMVNGIIYDTISGSLDAINATTGAIVWSYSSGYLGAPLAVFNNVVYMYNFGMLFAFDALTGNLLWTFSIAHQFSSPPTVVNGIVFITDDVGNLYAMNAGNGKLLWSGTTNSYGIAPAVANGVLYEWSQDGNLDALNPKTGKLFWSFAIGNNVAGTPSIANDILYLCTAPGMIAIDLKTHALLWSYANSSLFCAGEAVANGVVYAGSGKNGTLYALSAKTGVLLWPYSSGIGIFSSPVVANGVVYFSAGAGNNETYALNAQDGTLLWSYSTQNNRISAPIVANGMVYFGADKLYAFHLSN